MKAAGKGRFPVRVVFNSTNANVSSNATGDWNVTIWDKGNESTARIPHENECGDGSGCSFTIPNDQDNPVDCGNMNIGGNCDETKLNWTVTAKGPLNSEWDIYVNFTYDSTFKENNTKQNQPIRVRIVEHPWFEEYKAWNCRMQFNITNSTGGNGTVFVDTLYFTTLGLSQEDSDDICRMTNCTKEIRLTELVSGSQQRVDFLNVTRDLYAQKGTNFTFCALADFEFNTTLQANVTKTFFVYYNNPLAEINNTAPTGPDIHEEIIVDNPSLNETVWDEYFDSHIDFWWENASDPYPYGSPETRNASNITKNVTEFLGYSPQVHANRLRSDTLEGLRSDRIYQIFTHGGIVIMEDRNQTYWTNAYNRVEQDHIFADNISDLTFDIPATLVITSSSHGADTNTSLTGCPLQNWLTKALTDKGARCVIAFRGVNMTTDCPGGCGGCDSDVSIESAYRFNECFWDQILQGKTIEVARSFANDTENCDKRHEINAVLVNTSSCDITL